MEINYSIPVFNIVLKGSILSCLFFILAHNNSYNNFYKKIFVSKDDTSYIGMIIIFCSFYILNGLM